MTKEELMEMLKRQEGRTLEFKKTLPANSDLARCFNPQFSIILR